MVTLYGFSFKAKDVHQITAQYCYLISEITCIEIKISSNLHGPGKNGVKTKY